MEWNLEKGSGRGDKHNDVDADKTGSCIADSSFVQCMIVEASWNVLVHAQKPDFVFRRKGRVPLTRRGGRQFSRILAAELCTSAIVMFDTPCSEVVWRVLATHSIRQFPLYFPAQASHCAITFQIESSTAEAAGLCILVANQQTDVNLGIPIILRIMNFDLNRIRHEVCLQRMGQLRFHLELAFWKTS